jgi:hypothetical protein
MIDMNIDTLATQYIEAAKALDDIGFCVTVYGTPTFVSGVKKALPNVTVDTHPDFPESTWITVHNEDNYLDMFYTETGWFVNNTGIVSNIDGVLSYCEVVLGYPVVEDTPNEPTMVPFLDNNTRYPFAQEQLYDIAKTLYLSTKFMVNVIGDKVFIDERVYNHYSIDELVRDINSSVFK